MAWEGGYCVVWACFGKVRNTSSDDYMIIKDLHTGE